MTRLPTAIRFPQELHQQLVAAADERELSVNQLVCRYVVAAAKPNTPKVDRERIARKLLMRLDEPDPRRAVLLRDAASNLRNDPDGLRLLQAARNVLLHPPGPSSETAKPEHLAHTTSKET